MFPFAVTQYFRKVSFAPEVKVNEQVEVAKGPRRAAWAAKFWAEAASACACAFTLGLFVSAAKLSEHMARAMVVTTNFCTIYLLSFWISMLEGRPDNLCSSWCQRSGAELSARSAKVLKCRSTGPGNSR